LSTFQTDTQVACNISRKRSFEGSIYTVRLRMTKTGKPCFRTDTCTWPFAISWKRSFRGSVYSVRLRM